MPHQRNDDLLPLLSTAAQEVTEQRARQKPDPKKQISTTLQRVNENQLECSETWTFPHCPNNNLPLLLLPTAAQKVTNQTGYSKEKAKKKYPNHSPESPISTD